MAPEGPDAAAPRTGSVPGAAPEGQGLSALGYYLVMTSSDFFTESRVSLRQLAVMSLR
jgi:hypothetical protein